MGVTFQDGQLKERFCRSGATPLTPATNGGKEVIEKYEAMKSEIP